MELNNSPILTTFSMNVGDTLTLDGEIYEVTKVDLITEEGYDEYGRRRTREWRNLHIRPLSSTESLG